MFVIFLQLEGAEDGEFGCIAVLRNSGVGSNDELTILMSHHHHLASCRSTSVGINIGRCMIRDTALLQSAKLWMWMLAVLVS